MRTLVLVQHEGRTVGEISFQDQAQEPNDEFARMLEKPVPGGFGWKTARDFRDVWSKMYPKCTFRVIRLGDNL